MEFKSEKLISEADVGMSLKILGSAEVLNFLMKLRSNLESLAITLKR
jgi:hypothetical protein